MSGAVPSAGDTAVNGRCPVSHVLEGRDNGACLVSDAHGGTGGKATGAVTTLSKNTLK